MTELDDDLVPAVLELATDLGKDVDVFTEDLDYVAATGATDRSVVRHAAQKLLGFADVELGYIERNLAQQGDAQAIWAASGLAFEPVLGTRIFIPDAKVPGLTWSPPVSTNGAIVQGATSVAVDATSLTGRVVQGRQFRFGTGSDGYAATDDVVAASNAATIAFAPALVEASIADDTAVQFGTFWTHHRVEPIYSGEEVCAYAVILRRV